MPDRFRADRRQARSHEQILDSNTTEATLPWNQMKKTYHVTFVANRTWQLSLEGEDVVLAEHMAQSDAITCGRQFARWYAPSQLIVHRPDDTVESSEDFPYYPWAVPFIP